MFRYFHQKWKKFAKCYAIHKKSSKYFPLDQKYLFLKPLTTTALRRILFHKNSTSHYEIPRYKQDLFFKCVLVKYVELALIIVCYSQIINSVNAMPGGADKALIRSYPN